jgi:hypothetical protein
MSNGLDDSLEYPRLEFQARRTSSDRLERVRGCPISMYNGHSAHACPRDDINNAAGDRAEKANLQQGSPFATLIQSRAGRKAMAVCVIEQISAVAKPVFSLPLKTAYASSTTITARVLNLVAESGELWQ